jgi:hypothetical protein
VVFLLRFCLSAASLVSPRVAKDCFVISHRSVTSSYSTVQRFYLCAIHLILPPRFSSLLTSSNDTHLLYYYLSSLLNFPFVFLHFVSPLILSLLIPIYIFLFFSTLLLFFQYFFSFPLFNFYPLLPHPFSSTSSHLLYSVLIASIPYRFSVPHICSNITLPFLFVIFSSAAIDIMSPPFIELLRSMKAIESEIVFKSRLERSL